MSVLTTLSGWGEAIKAFMLSLPGMTRIAEWIVGKVKKSEVVHAEEEAEEVSGAGDAGASGRELRKRMRKH